MAPIRVALAQIAPRLGALEENLQRHLELIAQARGHEADLVVFPELGLTGYLLQDLSAEVAMRRDDPRLLELAQAAGDMSVVVSFVEESSDHKLFISAALTCKADLPSTVGLKSGLTGVVPVICQTASTNCSAVIRLARGPAYFHFDSSSLTSAWAFD